MIEAIAFDFGQVIGFFDHGRALAQFARHTDMSQEEMFTAVFDSEVEEEFESGRMEESEFCSRIRELCRLRCDDELVAAAAADIFWPNEAVCALIPQLNGRYRLVLGSNTNSIHVRRFNVQFAETLEHFDARILSHEVGVRKPAREFFEHVIRAAAVPPQKCVFVDDLPENVDGAEACGMKGIVYNGVEDLKLALSRIGVKV